MNLKSELSGNYNIQKIDTHQFQIEVSFPKSFSYFQGHFPDLPVLPAFGYIDISLFFLQQCFPLENLSLKSVQYLKMKKIISHSTAIQITLRKLQNSELNSCFEAEWTDCASTRLLF